MKVCGKKYMSMYRTAVRVQENNKRMCVGVSVHECDRGVCESVSMYECEF